MYHVKITTAYKKSYKLMVKRGLDLSELDKVVDMLRQGRQLDEKYRDHALTGNFTGFRECHVRPDWLLIYLIEDPLYKPPLTSLALNPAVITANPGETFSKGLVNT